MTDRRIIGFQDGVGFYATYPDGHIVCRDLGNALYRAGFDELDEGVWGFGVNPDRPRLKVRMRTVKNPVRYRRRKHRRRYNRPDSLFAWVILTGCIGFLAGLLCGNKNDNNR